MECLWLGIIEMLLFVYHFKCQFNSKNKDSPIVFRPRADLRQLVLVPAELSRRPVIVSRHGVLGFCVVSVGIGMGDYIARVGV